MNDPRHQQDPRMPTRTAIIRAEGEGDALWFNNDLFTFKTTADETDCALTLFEELSQRGKVTPLHLHPNADETFWVLDGEIRVYIDGTEQTVGPGGVASVPRGIAHAVMVTSDTSIKGINDKPIIVGPWISEVGYELLYWIPLVRWARETYGLAPDRFVVVSRGGVKSWYSDLAHRYVDLFDYYSPADFAAFNIERQKTSGMQKQKGVADLELKLVSRIEKDLGLGACDLLHPRLMYSGVFRYHWSQRSAMDHLLLHARYERFEIPEPGEIEGRLPEDYYAVRFYSRESFGDSLGNRSFVRHTIERMLEKRDVVLLDSPFAVDDHTNVDWMKAAGNGSRYNNRLVRAEEWMVPRNNLDVQSRIIARSNCFVGTYGGLSYLAGFYGRPSIAFHEQFKDVMDSHYNTAMTLFRALGAPLVLLTPDEANLVSDIL
jgi:mannose-6-phosphate isomerase-like protein (cupin superfamily)